MLFNHTNLLTQLSSATALQSVEIACDSLLSGKAKVMLAGGCDDLSEEGSYEFANMKATSNSETEFAMGREPTEMSRPTTTTRSGVSVSFETPYFMSHALCSVHGVHGIRCSSSHERQDRPRTWRTHSRRDRFHLDILVRLFSLIEWFHF